MANTPPKPPIRKRPSEDLIEALCVELRHVACNESFLPDGERVITHVREVCAIHAEIVSRQIDSRPRLEQLSAETGWQIPPLLDDCLAYPQKLPYVREADGVRRFLRCHLCAKAERPPDAKVFWFCDVCMHRVLDALKHRTPFPGIILFRTYNVECRCTHADAETVLAGDASFGDEIYGFCENCILDELARRERDLK